MNDEILIKIENYLDPINRVIVQKLHYPSMIMFAKVPDFVEHLLSLGDGKDTREVFQIFHKPLKEEEKYEMKELESTLKMFPKINGYHEHLPYKGGRT